MKYRKPVTHYDIEYLLTIFSANLYYQAQFVGVISKRNRGPVFFVTQCMVVSTLTIQRLSVNEKVKNVFKNKLNTRLYLKKTNKNKAGKDKKIVRS